MRKQVAGYVQTPKLHYLRHTCFSLWVSLATSRNFARFTTVAQIQIAPGKTDQFDANRVTERNVVI